MQDVSSTHGPLKAGRTSPRLSGEALDTMRHAGQLAGHRVLVNHALADGALHLRLCGLDGGLGGSLVAAGDRGFDRLDRVTDPRPVRLIAQGALGGLADTLAG